MAATERLKGVPTFYHLHLKHALPTTIMASQAYPIHLILSNEMDMFLPIDNQQSIVIETQIRSVSRDDQHTLRVSITPPSKPIIQKNGRGAFDISIEDIHMNNHILSASTPSSFYLQFSASGSLGNTILPAMSGPHSLIPYTRKFAALAITGGEPLTRLHSFNISNTNESMPRISASSVNLPFIIVREICGTFIGGRVWDCALYLQQYTQQYIFSSSKNQLNHSFFNGRKIIELGSGTGVFGLWLYASLMHHAVSSTSQISAAASNTEILLTDQEEVMELLNDNVQKNKLHLTTMINAPDTLSIQLDTSPLLFGSISHLSNLSISPPFDLIIGSDIIFNPTYFDDLLTTLKYLSSPSTSILLAYRPRGGLNNNQDSRFWQRLIAANMRYEIVHRYDNVFIVWIKQAS